MPQRLPCLVLGIAVLPLLWAFRPDTTQQAIVTVNVETQCTGEGVTVSITPWEAVVGRGDELQWAFTGADSLDVTPMRGWPFPQPPGRARRNERARAGVVPGNAQPQARFPYQVILYCGERRIVVDPDVVIGDEN